MMKRQYWVVGIIGVVFFCLTMIGIAYMTNSAVYGWGYDVTTFWLIVSIIGIIGVLGSIGYWALVLLPKENPEQR